MMDWSGVLKVIDALGRTIAQMEQQLAQQQRQIEMLQRMLSDAGAERSNSPVERPTGEHPGEIEIGPSM